MTLSHLFLDHISHLQACYEKLLDLSGFDAVVLHAGLAHKQCSVDDQYWPLRVGPSFAHWLPLAQEGAMVVVTPTKTPLLLRPAIHSFWESPVPLPGTHFLQCFEVKTCTPEAMRAQLPPGKIAFIGDAVEVGHGLGIASKNCNPKGLVTLLDATRTTKTAYEIVCLEEATRIAVRGHQEVHSEFHRDHNSELDLHLSYLQITEQDGSDTPYGNIVAQGKNAAVLHHIHYSRTLDTEAEQSLLVDAGASYMGYASDITRTTVRGQGQAARDFGALIRGLDAIQQDLCKAAKPGLKFERLHDLAHEALAILLVESGLCTGSQEALVVGGVTRAFFPHGLGHSLGLQVHDVGCRLTPPVGDHRFLRNTSTIATGQVFTIEPGCYFIDALLNSLRQSPSGKLLSWASISALAPFGGIRIEDNLVVEASGSRNLTRDNWRPKP